MTLNAAGNTSAWLAGSARIPFVVGLDRYLPPVLGRLHHKYETPWIALVTQSVASSAFILVNAIGASVHDMYLVLLQTTIVLQLIPYLYMFAALLRVARAPTAYNAAASSIRHPALLQLAAVTGFAVTAGGVAFAFIPSGGVENALTFEVKLLLGTVGFLLPAVMIYRIQSRRMPEAGKEVPVEAYFK